MLRRNGRPWSTEYELYHPSVTFTKDKRRDVTDTQSVATTPYDSRPAHYLLIICVVTKHYHHRHHSGVAKGEGEVPQSSRQNINICLNCTKLANLVSLE